MIPTPKKKKNPSTDTLTKLYLKKCTEEGAFVNGKLNRKYFAIRNHFEEDKQVTIDNLIIYLKELEQNQIISLTDLYHFAELHRKKKIMDHERSINLSIQSENSIRYDVDKFLML